MKNNMNHPSEWDLQLFSERELTPEDHEYVQAHVSVCSACESTVREYTALFSTLEALPRFSPSAGFVEGVLAQVNVSSQRSYSYHWMGAALGAAWMSTLPLVAIVLYYVGFPYGTSIKAYGINLFEVYLYPVLAKSVLTVFANPYSLAARDLIDSILGFEHLALFSVLFSALSVVSVFAIVLLVQPFTQKTYV